jgi:hypothetical protein
MVERFSHVVVNTLDYNSHHWNNSIKALTSNRNEPQLLAVKRSLIKIEKYISIN